MTINNNNNTCLFTSSFYCKFVTWILKNAICIFLTVPCVTRFLAGLHITHFLFFNKLIFVHLINRKQKKKKKKREEKSNPISKSISETLCHSWNTLSCETIAIQHVGLKSYGVFVFVSASSGFQQLRITNWDYYAH